MNEAPSQEKSKESLKLKSTQLSVHANIKFLQLKGWVQLLRPFTSVIAGALGFASYFHASDDHSNLIALLVFVICCLLSSAGFAMNDFFDIQKDTIGRRQDKPLVNGSLKEKPVVIGITVMSFAVIFMAALINQATLLYSVIGLLALALYSPFAVRIPFAKGLYTSFLTCLPLIIGRLAIQEPIPFSVCFAIVLFITGREVLIDITDAKADLSFNLFTVPNVIGRKNAYVTGSCLMVIGLIYSSYVLSGVIVYTSLAISLFVLVTLLALYGENIPRVISLSRIPMFIAIFAIAVGS